MIFSRYRINVGDVVLIGLRDFQDSKADIILKYTPDEARLLKSYGELADTVKVNEDAGPEDDDGMMIHMLTIIFLLFSLMEGGSFEDAFFLRDL